MFDLVQVKIKVLLLKLFVYNVVQVRLNPKYLLMQMQMANMNEMNKLTIN